MKITAARLTALLEQADLIYTEDDGTACNGIREGVDLTKYIAKLADLLHAEPDGARRDALEEAAEACDALDYPNNPISRAIRALIELP